MECADMHLSTLAELSTRYFEQNGAYFQVKKDNEILLARF